MKTLAIRAALAGADGLMLIGGADVAPATYGRDPDGNVVELQEIHDPESAMALDLG